MPKISLQQRLSIYADLRRHRRLATHRSLFHNKNNAAKIVIYILFGIVVLYLLSLAILMALTIGTSSNPQKPFWCIIPFLLVIDFFIRFQTQQTPAQMIQPYILLPIPRSTLIESFLISILFNIENFVWQCFTIPYAIMTIIPRKGIWIGLGCILAFQILLFIISQFYLLCRTLINDHLYWWLLPLTVFGLLFSPAYLGQGASIKNCIDTFMTVGNLFTKGNIFVWFLLFMTFAALFYLNRRSQLKHVLQELSRQETIEIKNIHSVSGFKHLGLIGEYMALEIKLLTRNKHPRKTLCFALLYVIIFGSIISLSNILSKDHTGIWENNLICFACFMITGANFVQRIMGYEGNYIDFLMVHRENIYSLLVAKYYCYSALPLIPLVWFIPICMWGTWNPLMIVAYFLYTIGPLHLAIFHLAIFNDQTIPLNSKIITTTKNDYNYISMIFTLCIFSLPMGILSVVKLFTNITTTYWILIVMSIPFIIFHRPIIKNIYRLMMKRKYSHLENFKASI